ncbi:MAG: flagellar biosynthesis protein FlhF [Pseudomonadota bacterium]
MEIRRYSASDTRSAMRLVRAEMGSDAVILSTKPIAGGVELVTASDYDPDLLASVHPEKSEATGDHGARDESAASDIATDEVQRELSATVRDLRVLLEREARRQPGTGPGTRNPQAAAFTSQLTELGFGAAAIRRLLPHVPSTDGFMLTTEPLTAALASLLGNDSLPGLDDGGVFAAVGPTGVGKTTTIAKLAVRLAMRHSTEDIALVSTDSSRLGAHHQLGSLGRLLAIPVFELDEASDLTEIAHIATERPWVLVDTAGSGDTAARAQQLARIVERSGRPLSLLLTLAANAQPDFLTAVMKRHRQALTPSIVLTKLDECPLAGPAVGRLIEAALPLVCASTGPAIPEDLVLGPDSLALVAHAALQPLPTARQSTDTARIDREVQHECA